MSPKTLVLHFTTSSSHQKRWQLRRGRQLRSRDRKIVFLCYNRTGVLDAAALELFGMRTKSYLPRRTDSTDVLIVLTRDAESRDLIWNQLPMFPNNFKYSWIFVGASSRWRRSSPLLCIKQLFTKMSFGFRMRLLYSARQPRSLTDCVSDWHTIDGRKPCPRCCRRFKNSGK